MYEFSPTKMWSLYCTQSNILVVESYHENLVTDSNNLLVLHESNCFDEILILREFVFKYSEIRNSRRWLNITIFHIIVIVRAGNFLNYYDLPVSSLEKESS